MGEEFKDFNEYQQLASRTGFYNKEDLTYVLMYLSMGLAGEMGEVIEKIKKVIRNDKGIVTDEKRDSIKQEIGDVLWYLSQLALHLDIKFGDTASANIKKLADRAERGVIKSEGDTR